jgi:1-deoxy-D-xylulose-5-phosphate reductoisomerase
MKNIAIIGSTGSIGRQTLEVIKANPAHYRVAALACHGNIGLLEKQIRKFRPHLAVVVDRAAAEKLKKKLGSFSATLIMAGSESLKDLAVMTKTDTVMFAASGTGSLPALYAAIKARKGIAIANKELIVCEGPKIMAAAKKNKVEIIPVDSEHSAIFQCLRGEKTTDVEKVILTCSGGPFYGLSKKELKKITLAQALKHPVWKMGADISLDSATLMNKAFEIIEAAYLFGLRADQIEVVIHPECVIHSLVQFKDGSIKAQLSVPDMRHHIAYALAYPQRIATEYRRLDLSALGKITFIKPDYGKFEGPLLAYEALKSGKGKPGRLLLANQRAIKKFRNGEISFPEIYVAIRQENMIKE